MKADEAREILGVSNTTNRKKIDDAFKKKVKIFHPDQNSSPDANKEFKKLKKAREVLKEELENNGNQTQSNSSETNRTTEAPTSESQTTDSTAEKETSRSQSRHASNAQTRRERERWRTDRRQTTKRTQSSHRSQRQTQRETNKRSPHQRANTTKATADDRQTGFGKEANRSSSGNRARYSSQSKAGSQSNTHTQSGYRHQRSTQSSDSGWRSRVQSGFDTSVGEQPLSLFESVTLELSRIKWVLRQTRPLDRRTIFAGYNRFLWAFKHLIIGGIYSIGVVIVLLLVLTLGAILQTVTATLFSQILTLICVMIIFLYCLREPAIGPWLFGILIVGSAPPGTSIDWAIVVLSLCGFVISSADFIRCTILGQYPWRQLNAQHR